MKSPILKRLPHLPTTFVYLIEMDDGSAGKIGLATNPRARFHSIKTGNVSGMSLKWYVRGGRDIERALHKGLADYRIKLEWYREPDLLSLIFDNLVDRLYDRADEQMEADGVIDLDGYYDRQTVTVADVASEVASCLAYWNSDERLENDAEIAASRISAQPKETTNA
jgi:hypothetical protein